MKKLFLGALVLVVAISGLLVVYSRSIRNAGDRDGDRFIMQSEAGSSETANVADVESFMRLMSRDKEEIASSIQDIQSQWHFGSTIMMLEAARIARSNELLQRVVWLAESRTGQYLGADFNSWYRWLWTQDYDPHPQYAQFKSELYSKIDPSFQRYFLETENAKIRLDEIVWGGVKRDGIPPLKNPKMVSVEQAVYLEESNVVFGVVINEDARCYPKRVLAWHEMFKDTIGGHSVCGVY